MNKTNKTFLRLSSALLVVSLIIACDDKKDTMNNIEFNPPETKTVAHFDTVHGEVIADPYRWLEDKNDSEVREWSEKQTEFTHNFITEMGPDIDGLREELEAIYDREVKSAPFYISDKQFVSRKAKGDKHATLYRIMDEDTVKIFSPTDIDSTGVTSWFDAAYNSDGSVVAVATQYKGNEIATYRFFDTETLEEIYKPIGDLRSLVFSEDGKNAYVTRRSQQMIDNQDPLPTYLHRLGTDTSKDKSIITAPSAKHFAQVYDDPNGPFTYTIYGDFYSDTVHIKPLGSSGLGKKVYESSEFNAYPKYHDGKFYFITNDNSPNFKIMMAPANDAEYDNWVPFIDESEDMVIKDFVFRDTLAYVLYKQDVLSRLAVYDMDGNKVRQLELPEVADIGSITYNKKIDKFFVSAKSFTSPTKIYEMDPGSEEFSLYFNEPSPINTDNIEVKFTKYASKDGTTVPIFIMYDKDMVREGDNPALLYGYGGFNISLTPSFIKDIATFINRGGVYAIANLRGGSEYGESWHTDGMLDKKQNVFDDFISAAEYLIDEGYTNSSRLAISGRSNGGLLTGAALTQRPDLYKAVVIGVPLLDMLRYDQFLIAQYWIPEYGNPAIKEEFDWLKAYSPYHNIDPDVNYPNTFIHTGEYDTRVDPLHAKKMAAMLQNGANQTNPILLDIDFEGGHGSGGSGKSAEKLIDTRYRELKFIMNSVGIK
jgi:prolyl oligopeptidase